MDHLKYYKSISDIPVVNLGDLPIKEIIKQRKKFYFNLGLTENNFKNMDVLEACAGTGYNAQFLSNVFKAKKITCLDNNPSSINKLKKIYQKLKIKK